MFLIGTCVEMFTTTSEYDCEMYDQIYILKNTGKYVLEIGERCSCVNAYDVDNSCEISSTYVDRFIFDMIVDGLNKRGYKRCYIALGE